MQYNDGYDGSQGYVAETEAQQEHEWQAFLRKLIENGENDLFAAYVAIDWLHSKEFVDSGLSAVEFITKQKNKFQSKLMEEWLNFSIDKLENNKMSPA